jgi:hypothetical protein
MSHIRRLISRRQRRNLRLHRLSKEKLGGRIEGQAEEQWGEIDLGGPARGIDWEMLHHVLDVGFFEFEVRDLVAGELGAEERAGVFPALVVMV